MVVTRDTLLSGRDGELVSGVVLIKGYSQKVTKAGKPYIDGFLQSGVIVPFKIWDGNPLLSEFLKYDYTNTPCQINGTFNVYQGTTSIILNAVYPTEEYSPEQFFEVKYNASLYTNALIDACNSVLSTKGVALLNQILFSNSKLMERFTKEFAASGHHDNCLSGLLAHTYKVVCLMSWVLATYSKIVSKPDGTIDADKKDLLIIGAVLHDIGKVDEMKFGVYQPLSTVTHRVLGLDYLFDNKDAIIGTYNEKWYRDLQSIIVEHHGEFGDPCRSVVAYVTHKADMFDCQMTMLEQTIDAATSQGISDKVYVDGGYLAL